MARATTKMCERTIATYEVFCKKRGFDIIFPSQILVLWVKPTFHLLLYNEVISIDQSSCMSRRNSSCIFGRNSSQIKGNHQCCGTIETINVAKPSKPSRLRNHRNHQGCETIETINVAKPLKLPILRNHRKDLVRVTLV